MKVKCLEKLLQAKGTEKYEVIPRHVNRTNIPTGHPAMQAGGRRSSWRMQQVNLFKISLLKSLQITTTLNVAASMSHRSSPELLLQTCWPCVTEQHIPFSSSLTSWLLNPTSPRQVWCSSDHTARQSGDLNRQKAFHFKFSLFLVT